MTSKKIISCCRITTTNAVLIDPSNNRLAPLMVLKPKGIRKHKFNRPAREQPWRSTGSQSCLLADRASYSRAARSDSLGGQAARAVVQGFTTRVSRHAGVVYAEPEAHVFLRVRIHRGSNWATTCCLIALGSQHSDPFEINRVIITRSFRPSSRIQSSSGS